MPQNKLKSKKSLGTQKEILYTELFFLSMLVYLGNSSTNRKIKAHHLYYENSHKLSGENVRFDIVILDINKLLEVLEKIYSTATGNNPQKAYKIGNIDKAWAIGAKHLDKCITVVRNNLQTSGLEQISTNGMSFEIFFRYICWFPGSEQEPLHADTFNGMNKNHLANSFWMVTAEMFTRVIGRTVSVNELRYSFFHPTDGRMVLTIPCLDGSYMHDKCGSMKD